jgi:hypothetical protein
VLSTISKQQGNKPIGRGDEPGGSVLTSRGQQRRHILLQFGRPTVNFVFGGWNAGQRKKHAANQKGAPPESAPVSAWPGAEPMPAPHGMREVLVLHAEGLNRCGSA